VKCRDLELFISSPEENLIEFVYITFSCVYIFRWTPDPVTTDKSVTRDVVVGWI